MSRSKLALGALTHTRERQAAAPVCGQVVRGLGGLETDAALGSTAGKCRGLWLAKYKQIACQSPGHG